MHKPILRCSARFKKKAKEQKFIKKIFITNITLGLLLLSNKKIKCNFQVSMCFIVT